MGGRSIACLNARDRNLLGFRRDLLTAAAYGVDEFLFVYGDRPTSGDRTGQLTVRSMIESCSRSATEHRTTTGTFRAGVTTGLRPVPAVEAGSRLPVRPGVVLDSTSCSPGGHTSTSTAPVYAGVMVRAERRPWPASSAPTSPRSRFRALDRCDRDDRHGRRRAGVRAGRDHRDSGAFDGVHLIPGVRYRQTAACLEEQRLT